MNARDAIFAAIDVGTNAARLKVARPQSDGTFEVLESVREAIRPGEGVFKTGVMPEHVIVRLVDTMRRFGKLAARHGATVRAAGTSALREAKNKKDILARVKDDADVDLEIISGLEEARLICLGVTSDLHPTNRNLLIDIGGGSAEVIHTLGEQPMDLWSLPVGAVRLTELFSAHHKVTPKTLKLMRDYTLRAAQEALPGPIDRAPKMAIGSSGTIRAIVAYATEDKGGPVHVDEMADVVARLAGMSSKERLRRFEERRAEVIVAGAVILEAIMHHLGLKEVSAVRGGLKDGLLVDLRRRSQITGTDSYVSDEAFGIARRFHVDEDHAKNVRQNALSLFDDLARLHDLPASARPLLEVAAILHDVGYAISRSRHHKHSYYLIANTELPGLTDRERELAALIARFHRRSAPKRTHQQLEQLTRRDYQTVRRCAVLLRMADALDRSHRQVVTKVRAQLSEKAVTVRMTCAGDAELEVWDVAREQELFERVFDRALVFEQG